MKYFLQDIAGSVYEIVTGQSHAQRTIKRKIGNLFRKTPKRSWEDGRTNTQCCAVTPTTEECNRLNHEAARSI